MARTGRPKAVNPKDIRYSIRIDRNTEEKLIAYCKRNNITKGEVFRLAVLKFLEKE